MKAFITCLLFFLMSLTPPVLAGHITEIELKDGGVIVGEIISQADGVYRVRTKSLGVVEVKGSAIRGIRPASEGAPAKGVSGRTGASPPPDIEELQRSIMQNKEVMPLILSLQNDPEVQALLKDPDILAAIQSGDVAALMADPKFMKILNHAKIKEIQEKILSQNPGPK